MMLEVWGQQEKTEIGGFYMIGSTDPQLNGCIAYVAQLDEAKAIVRAVNSHAELLEALESILDDANSPEYEGYFSQSSHIKAEAAIAKARGL